MANLTVLNLLGNTDNNNATFVIDWGVAVAVTGGAGAPSGVSTIGELYFDETANSLYEATTLDWSAPTITLNVEVATFDSVVAGEIWYDETGDLLYTSEAVALVAPTEGTGFVFSYFSLDPAGKTPITELDIEQDTTVYANWFRVGDYVFIRAFAEVGDAYAINKANIISIMPVHFAKVGGSPRWYLQYHTMLGGRILERTPYLSKELAVEARYQVITDLI
jgi:hypothetical protein